MMFDSMEEKKNNSLIPNSSFIPTSLYTTKKILKVLEDFINFNGVRSDFFIIPF